MSDGDSSENIAFKLPVPIQFALASPDSRRLAYAAGSGFNNHIFVNGKLVVTDAFWKLLAPIFSSDSSTFAFAGQRWFRWVSTAEGKSGPKFANIGRSGPTLSEDGKHIAYTGKRKGGWYAVVDHETVGGPYEGFAPGGIVFSPNGKKYGYVVKRNRAWAAVVNGVEQEHFPSILTRSWTFSPDGDSFAYVAIVKLKAQGLPFVGEASVVRNGSVLKPFKHDEATRNDGLADEIVFSPDSHRMAYIVVRQGRSFVEVDGELQRGCDGLVSGYGGHPQWRTLPNFANSSVKPQTISFSSDSNHFAYAGRSSPKGTCVLVLDGLEFDSHESVLNSPILFSPMNILAYAACEKNNSVQFYVIDRQRGVRHQSLPFGTGSFSPDGQRFAYLAGDRGTFAVMLNERRLPLGGVPIVGANPVWDHSSLVHTFALDGSTVSVRYFT